MPLSKKENRISRGNKKVLEEKVFVHLQAAKIAEELFSFNPIRGGLNPANGETINKKYFFFGPFASPRWKN